jgi:hypothetical protein
MNNPQNQQDQTELLADLQTRVRGWRDWLTNLIGGDPKLYRAYDDGRLRNEFEGQVISILKAKLKEAENALAFYADEKNWHEINTKEIENNPLECKAVPMVAQQEDGGVSYHADCGDKARKALSPDKKTYEDEKQSGYTAP